MPCLCQYFATEVGLRVKASLDVKDNDEDDHYHDNDGNGNNKGEVITGEVNASELTNCKAEILKLHKDLSSYRISSENMEVLMKKMIDEQHFLVTEIFELKKSNEDMRMQQVADRNNQALERSALIRELHEIKIQLRERSNDEKILQQNEALTNALKEANEKIYEMGIKYLKLRGYRRTSSNASKDEETKSISSDE
ncbi:uncharacterized protein LOC129942446 isoform X2 [Eupeodes corollae]|uniref:uncharacterized protein LOC129942446 isoform X2 n=1 Tax=Eupeodes corollae TaxID=290404 RepID=UPI00249220C4|nr:uncharacterized protein LOC129942446 isoform X2 [Eupeodes corollae]